MKRAALGSDWRQLFVVVNPNHHIQTVTSYSSMLAKHTMNLNLRKLILALSLVLPLAGCQTVPLVETNGSVFAAPVSSQSGQVRIGAFHIPKDEPGTIRTFFQLGGPNRDRPFGVSVFDITREMRYLGTLPEGPYHYPQSWLEYETTPGKHTLMLAAGLAVHRIDWLNVDFIEVDVQPGGVNHVALSRYGFLSLPYLGEVQISDSDRKYCDRLTGTRREREKSALAYMAVNGIDPNAKDFVRFCLVLSDPKHIVGPTDEARRQFEEFKPHLEKLRAQRHEKWKSEVGKRAPYDLMRSYQPVEAGVVN
jgi:hypothetical protein